MKRPNLLKYFQTRCSNGVIICRHDCHYSGKEGNFNFIFIQFVLRTEIKFDFLNVFRRPIGLLKSYIGGIQSLFEVFERFLSFNEDVLHGMFFNMLNKSVLHEVKNQIYVIQHDSLKSWRFVVKKFCNKILLDH